MLDKEFKTWLADPIFDIIFIIYKMHITYLGSLEDGLFCIIDLLDGNTRESNMLKRLNKIVIISNNNDKHLPDLSNLETK